jgi:predicted permease
VETPEQKISQYFDRITNALQSIPGVSAVAVTSALPFSPDRGSNTVEPQGYTPAKDEVLDAERRFITANYVRTMGMKIVAGRDFTEADDRAGAPTVVLVNESLARRFWPNESAVGKHLGFWGQDPLPTIVGVVRDPRETDLRGETSSKFYVPTHKLSDGGGSLLIRTRLDPKTITPIVRERLWRIDPTLAITQIMPMRERMRESVADQRYRMRLMLAFSALAAIFAIAGVYGVMSRAATRRRRELGIRSALGALYGQLVQLMLLQGATLAALGVSIGLTAAYFATRVLESMLYETARADPLVMLAIAGLLSVLALLATWQPARRAARVQPMEVLRSE